MIIVSESNENNNDREEGTGWAGPDLIVEDVWIDQGGRRILPAEVDASKSFEVWARLKNRGGADAARFWTSCYLDGEYAGEEDLLWGLDAGKHHDEKIATPTVSAAESARWSVTLSVRADISPNASHHDRIKETNETNNTRSGTVEVVVPRYLKSVAVSGSSTVDEKWPTDYKATAHFSDGSSSDVTSQTTWQVDSSYAHFDSSVKGKLHIEPTFCDLGYCLPDEPLTVTATYTYGQDTKSDSLSVTVRPYTSIDTTPPGAKLYVNGEIKATTPYGAYWFNVGDVIKLTLEGYKNVERTLTKGDLGQDLEFELDSDIAQIVRFDPPVGVVERDTQAQATVRVENTGTATRSFWVGLSFGHEDADLQSWPLL